MTTVSKTDTSVHKPIKTILISQPKPERSPYYELEQKYGVQIDWRPFIHVEGVTEKEFRKTRIKPDQYSAVILTSNYSIEHFFRMCDDMRIKMSADTKYFCLTEAIANYLQKFIVYRKRKVFVGHRKIEDLATAFNKHKANESFLLPCSNLGSKQVTNWLDQQEIEFTEAMMYRTVSSDLSDLADITYDALVFFSPLGIDSLFDNFPDFKQNETRIAVFGNSTTKAVEDHDLTVNIKAPTPESPSMTMALEHYLKVSNPT